MPRRVARKLHIWIGWIAGVPLLFWTVSGLWMVARPIEEVRGERLQAPRPAIALPLAITPPQTGGATLAGIAIEPRLEGAVWVARFADGSARAADLGDGTWLPPILSAEASAIARAHYRGKAVIEDVTATTATEPPLELRRPRPAWRVAFADGACVYVDRDTGSVLALRTAQWRWFDWMWGLHIMDLEGREETSHPALIVAAALGLLTVALGLLLLPLSARPRRSAFRNRKISASSVGSETNNHGFD